MNAPIHGLMAEFKSPEALLAAADASTARGYTQMDAYTPFPVHGLARALGKRRSTLPLLFLLGGAAGGSGGYFMQWYAMAIDYPLNIGGRPFHSWPSFVPVTFELTILIAALTGVLGLFLSIRLPKPYDPVFNLPEFKRASDDRFFLCLKQSDPQFSLATTRGFLESLAPERVMEVPE